MNDFHHAAFWPFEVVVIDEALRLNAPIWALVAIFIAGLIYARYVGGMATDAYNTFPENLKIAPIRAIFAVGLIMAPIGVEKIIVGGFQIARYILHAAV